VWRETAQRKPGTWWEDWVRWAAETAGEMIDPPRMGSDRYPVLGEAPGRYVYT
jgi:polyhydroxyalkanoate synthase